MSDGQVFSTAFVEILLLWISGILLAVIVGWLGIYRIRSRIVFFLAAFSLGVVVFMVVAFLSEVGTYPYSNLPKNAPGSTAAGFFGWLLIRARTKRSRIPLLQKEYGKIECVSCGHEATVKKFLSWERAGKKGNRGKIPSGHIILACPKCDTEMKWDSLTGNVEKVIDAGHQPTQENLMPRAQADDSALYEKVRAELKKKIRDEGLWSKAMTQTLGNSEKAYWVYHGLRVEALKERAEQEEIRMRKESSLAAAKEQVAQSMRKRDRLKGEESTASIFASGIRKLANLLLFMLIIIGLLWLVSLGD